MTEPVDLARAAAQRIADLEHQLEEYKRINRELGVLCDEYQDAALKALDMNEKHNREWSDAVSNLGRDIASALGA